MKYRIITKYDAKGYIGYDYNLKNIKYVIQKKIMFMWVTVSESWYKSIAIDRVKEYARVRDFKPEIVYEIEVI